MKILAYCFFITITIFCLSTPVFAHLQPGPPYLLVNGQYANTVGTISRVLVVPQDAIQSELLVNTEVSFSVDLARLSLPPTTLAGSKWRWNWRPDNSNFVEGQALKHTFTKTGSYLIDLQIKDPTQSSFQSFDLVQVNITPKKPYLFPSAHITASIKKDGEAVMATFDTQTTTDPSTSLKQVSWDFGDGSTGQGATTTHKYQPFTNSIFPLARIEDQNGVYNDVQIMLSDSGTVEDFASTYPETASPRPAQSNTAYQWWVLALGAVLLTLIAVLIKVRSFKW